jgi:thioredoxin reductase
MTKVVINSCFGGFGLSHDATLRYAELKGLKLIVVEEERAFSDYAYYLNEISDDNYWYPAHDLGRSEPELVQVVEELGALASGQYAELKVVEIPDGVEWHIVEYDGIEHIAETHRTWS